MRQPTFWLKISDEMVRSNVALFSKSLQNNGKPLSSLGNQNPPSALSLAKGFGPTTEEPLGTRESETRPPKDQEFFPLSYVVMPESASLLLLPLPTGARAANRRCAPPSLPSIFPRADAAAAFGRGRRGLRLKIDWLVVGRSPPPSPRGVGTRGRQRPKRGGERNSNREREQRFTPWETAKREERRRPFLVKYQRSLRLRRHRGLPAWPRKGAESTFFPSSPTIANSFPPLPFGPLNFIATREQGWWG